MGAFRIVFKNWSYAALAGVTGVMVFTVAVWLPNLQLLRSIWLDPSIALADKLILPIRLLESITTNFTVLSASYTITAAVLIGINIAFAAYILKREKQRLSAVGITTGTLGIISGAFGLGCAACGSLILASLAATIGGVSLLALLPLRGAEFGMLGILLLAAATYFLSKHITTPAVCD